MKRAKNIVDIEKDFRDGTILVCSDVHIPFQDDKAITAFLSEIDDEQPNIIILNGDILDFFMLSRFTKGEGRNPAEEIHLCRKFLQEVRNAAGKDCKIFYVLGNHETRLERYVLTKAPELSSLVEDVFTILKVEDFDIRGCSSLILNHNIVFKHGTYLGSKSGLSAIKEMESSYSSGVSGHCHRLCKYIARKSGRKFFWVESGCLCDLNPEYVINPNWQQGFVKLTLEGGVPVSVKTYEIENGRVC